VIFATLALAGCQGQNSGGEDADALPTFRVRSGPLTIQVTEAGTIKARERLVLKNEVEGKTTILYLIPEGTRVTEGELLVELDASRLQDQRLDQQIRVQNAEAALIRARENLAVTENQAQSDTERAELDLRFAKEDLTKYVEGEYPNLLKEAESRIALAEEELQRAEEMLKWSAVLFGEKYISQTQLQADKLAAQKARLDLELAVQARDLLRDFTYKRTLAQLESEVKQAGLALERTRRKAAADVVQAKAELRTKEAESRREQNKLEKVETQIRRAKIYAPTDGLVVYATTAQFRWRGNVEPLAEGQEVRERQELIYLPTATAMMAEVKVHESNLDKVKVDLSVRVTVDARAGQVFTGRVASISPLPDARSAWLNPDLKIYRTEIHLDGDGSGLRTGMSCRAEIVVEEYDDVVYVPIQSVLMVGREPTAYVLRDGSVRSRQVEIGLDNNRMVRILSGLDPGEEVLLAPPLEPRATEGERARPPRERVPVAAAEPGSADTK
jgi:HlyD family secretion protein